MDEPKKTSDLPAAAAPAVTLPEAAEASAAASLGTPTFAALMEPKKRSPKGSATPEPKQEEEMSFSVYDFV